MSTMITKWKTILTNWINCNLTEPTAALQTVNHESLLSIVSHLHNNCLDQSKSSILEAQTLEEFILEKYPAFQFENGSAEPTTDEELYIAASLLLFFVCVNSKDADLKNAMCSRLSPCDQETILKYSKCLMECPEVTYKDVQSAILECCGRDAAAGESSVPRAGVAETPPALRSLHGEVRRLTAALDAERFDRTYLQEELARTQLKLDYLAKEKEEQKQTILSLKAKVSECCGQEAETRTEGSLGDAATVKLLRQIDELEQRVADTRQQLDDLVYESDTYKAKADELKRERDKCFAFGQQESANAIQLAEQLDSERRTVESLKEMVSELRQHYRHNGLDGSLLECDDDGSSHSFAHNLSLCNEACANVVEVQLAEERAKVAELTGQIEALRDHVTQINQKREEETLSWQKIISDKDEDILNLKHRINEGIEETNHIKVHLGNEITKLTNDCNELEQKIREINENHSKMIEEKMREVQTLQEEKLSLLQSLSDETTKLGEVIKDQEQAIQSLEADLNAERNTKQKLKEDYEAQIMKMKEKVLNRNNELVELQNNASKNSEIIETLHFELRKEKENIQKAKTEMESQITQFGDKLTAMENSYRLKLEEIQQLQNQKDVQIEQMEKTNSELKHDVMALQAIENKLTQEVLARDNTIEEYGNEIETLNQTIAKQKELFVHQLKEKQADLDKLQSKLNQEIQTRDTLTKSYETVIEELKVTITEKAEALTQQVNEKEIAIGLLQANLTREIQNRDDTIKAYEKDIATLKNTIDEQENALTIQINETEAIASTMKTYEKEIETLNDFVTELKNALTRQINEKEGVIKSLEDKLIQEIKVRDDTIKSYENEFEVLKDTIRSLNEDLKQKITESESAMTSLKENLSQEIQERENQIICYKKELESSKNTIEELNQAQKMLKLQLGDEISSYKRDIDTLNKTLADQQQALSYQIHEKDAAIGLLQMQLQTEVKFRENHQREMEELQKARDSLVAEVTKLSEEFNQLNQETQQKNKMIEAMDLYLQEEKSTGEKLKRDHEEMVDNLEKEFTDKCRDKDAVIEEMNRKLMAEVSEKEMLSALVESLKVKLDVNANDILILQESNSKLSEDLMEKKAAIEKLEQDLSEMTDKYRSLSKDFDSETSKLMTRLNETERILKELRSKSNKTIENKSLEVETLKMEMASLERSRNAEREAMEVIQMGKETLLSKLEEQRTYQEMLEAEYMKQCTVINEISTQLNNELAHEKMSVSVLIEKNLRLVEKLELCSDDIKSLEEQLAKKTETYNNLVSQKEVELEKLTKEVAQLSDRNINLTEDFNNEIQSKCATIEALQKENEKLLYTIEEENSKHGALIKEKDIGIENLEQSLKDITQQLTNLQHDFQEKTLQWETLKLEMKESLHAKTSQISEICKDLTETKASLEKAEKSFKQEKEILNSQIATLQNDKQEVISKLRTEIESLQQAVAIEADNVSEIIHQKEVLLDQLAEEKGVVESLQSEKIQLNKLIEEKKGYIDLLEKAKHELEVTSNFVNQNLIAEQTAKEELNEKLSSEMSEKKILLEEKEILTQQLVEEKSTKDLLQSEKKMLLEEKDTLVNDQDELKEKIIELEKKFHESKLEKEVLLKESDYLMQQLNEEKCAKENFEKSKNNLVNLNQTLISKVADESAINTLLAQEKELLIAEKETLVMNLSEEKAAKDMAENEKDIQEAKLEELKKQHADVLNSNLQEIKSVNEELQTLKSDLNEKYDLTERLTKTLNTGLGKLVKTLQNEDIQNELLKRLITVDNIDDIQLIQQCDLLVNIADTLTTELAIRKNLEKALEHENSALSDLREMLKQREMQLHELQMECKRLEQSLSDLKSESTMQRKTLTSNLKDKHTLIQSLEQENKSLNAEINDVKLQLELKVHSLKEKLVDNELLTDKLKRSYECQIENLNVMADKLTNYLKNKTVELEATRREIDRLQRVIDENNQAIKTLEESVKAHKQNEDKLITDFEAERAILKNMVTVTESVMEDQKAGFEKLVAEKEKINQDLQTENESLLKMVESEKQNAELCLKEKDSAFEILFKELTDLRSEKEELQKEFECKVESLKNEVVEKVAKIQAEEDNNKVMVENLDKSNKELANLKQKLNDLLTDNKKLEQLLKDKEVEYTAKLQNREIEFENEIKEQELKLQELVKLVEDKELKVQESEDKSTAIENKLQVCQEEIEQLTRLKDSMEKEKTQLMQKFEQFKALNEASNEKNNEEISKLRDENTQLLKIVEENKSVITNLDQLIKHELEQNQKLREQSAEENRDLFNKCAMLEEQQEKADKELVEKRKKVSTMNAEIKTLKAIIENSNVEETLTEKDSLINKTTKDLVEEQNLRAKCEKQLEMKSAELEVKSAELVRAKDEVLKLMSEREGMLALRKANEELFKSVSQRETLLTMTQEKTETGMKPTKQHGDAHQVAIPPNDITHTPHETNKTIVDLETIINDKNRTITTLQSDLTYLKTQIEDSETKMSHLTNELEVNKEHCTQLSNQLKKIVHQKNEEISDLKRQVSKMSVTENRASQIIKVSAKYQAIILKRIAEIKSNTVLKELTNFGNAANVDSELRRSIAGSVTMEDLENFLETTDRHLKRCSEKQIALQKERDRLAEVNRINESEIINMKKFLTEMSVSFKTFMSVKEMYAQRLSRIVSVQRTVRREILNLDGQITDAAMCHLERGYTAAMQDLSECVMNLERWVERSVSRTISSEKIKQAFASELDRASMASGTFQNAGLEVQLDELDGSFQKLLEEVSRAPRGEGAKDPQAVTVMEVRAEYEDKLNRMKSKMKQLYQEQIAIFRDKQKEEIAVLERELQKARDKMADKSRAYESHIQGLNIELRKILAERDEAIRLRLHTRDKMAESSRAYESHIRSLTAELWTVGEKFLMKKDEAEWLRRNKSGSLQSLQHLHSSGLVSQEESFRPSDVASLRSLPIRPKKTAKGGRGLHMSDEEGEVFDNQCLKELQSTPRAASPPAGLRLSELRWRNSLCPPHLKSSYPAETQFAAVQEDEIKCVGKQQRKEVGITAYKKPGPPTPSKQAGRLSATDSELRESLRPEAEPPRKTSTPSRLRSLFRSSRTEASDGTPRSRRLSIFRMNKK